jgi:hypothetical protein
MRHDEDGVEVLPALKGRSFDEDEVIGREDCDLERLEELTGPAESLSVGKDLVPPGWSDLDLDENAAAVILDFTAHDRTIAVIADQRFPWTLAKRLLRRAVADRFEQARLARTVFSGDDSETLPLGGELKMHEIPEITNLEPQQLAQDTLTGINRYR